MLSATPDSAVTTAGTPVTIAVLANDTGTGLVITSFSNPANGSLVYNSGDKSFTYTPDDGFSGVDTFSYTVLDQKGATATAEVTVRNCTLNYGTLVPSPLSEYGMLLVDAPDDCNKLVEEPDDA